MEKERYRGERIIFLASECHLKVDTMYEDLVDRDFESAKKEINDLISDLKIILKQIPEDDF